jgi:hypothetical protein
VHQISSIVTTRLAIKTPDQAYLRLQLENGTFMECSIKHAKILTEQGKFPLQTFIGCVNKEIDTNARFGKDAWLFNSGASVQIVKKKSYCSRTKEAQERVRIGDNGRMEYFQRRPGLPTRQENWTQAKVGLRKNYTEFCVQHCITGSVDQTRVHNYGKQKGNESSRQTKW